MRRPKIPPTLQKCISQLTEQDLLDRSSNDDVVSFLRRTNDKYLHWDKFRHHPMPEGMSPIAAWGLVALSRVPHMRKIPIAFYDSETELSYWTPPQHQEWLHQIDQQAGGSISTSSPFGVADDDEKYLFNSLMEEAIASSQLEGATTTREVAKKFLQTNRKPKDRSQRMILNNYLAIQEIRELKKEKLTPELLCHIQGIITKSTLSDESHEGRFRQPGDDKIVVEERMTGEVLHEPPDHFSVEWRVEEICDFANEKSKPFIHPVVKAIALHFAIGFVHPFIDGNGRTARAIFYWYMLKQGYWIFEFLPISRIFLDGPIKYARAYLYTETDDADLTYFCHYHMHVILRAITELHEYIAKQQEELKEAVDIVAGYSSELNHRQTDLIYDAIKHKGNVYTIAQHAGSHNVTKATARSDLFDLEAKGFLTKHKHSREWWFTPTEKLPS